MKKKIVVGVIALVVISLVAILISKSATNNVRKAELTPIRIGWQTSWAPQTQIAEVLKHTNILEKNGLVGDFKGFNYGGPLSEAAVAGQVDVLFMGDFPAINLISKTDKFTIVARLMDFRNGIIVPASSTIQSLADLRGKVISIPFGSSPHLHTLNFIKENGFDPTKDFQLKNLDILEQTNVIQKGSLAKWDGVDAFVTWDPTMAIFEDSGKARVLKRFSPVGVVVMSNDYISRHSAAAKDFLKAFIEDYYYYAKNQQQANQWFIDETKFSGSQSVIDKMSSLEKNLLAKEIKDVDVGLYDSHIKTLQAIADEAEANKLITKAPIISQKINLQFLDEAKKEIGQSNFDLNSVNIK